MFPGNEGSALAFDAVQLWVHGREGQVALLCDVTWQVRAGEHWAILGPNGAGKSSLLSLCAAMRHPSAGTVDVLGRRLGQVDMRELRARIGVVDVDLSRRMPAVVSLEQVALTGVTGAVLPRPEVYSDDDHARAAREIDRVGLKALRHRRFGDCSHGERQRALLARALVGQPELLLLDEAAVGLDLPAREALLAALVSAAQDTPARATVTVTHHVEELPPSTTHALLIREARVLAAGPARAVLTSERLSACFGLPITVRRAGERWTAQARGSWAP